MKIKLLVWDLDDTLWSGTLAENDAVELFEHRAGYIKALNGHGLVSAICSKNDYEQAKAKLRELGIWDEFVFRRIAFVPKGEAVKKIIEEMNLQPEHVLFIDDNHLNLQEVKYLLPSLNIVDARSSECDELLEKIIADNKHVGKSRVEDYRILDQKITDHAISGCSQREFLQSCKIRACMVNNTDNVDFLDRIEELINRTNQLNFLKTRVREGEMAAYVADGTKNNCYSIFVWDKYGHHGLVGFAAVEKGATLSHFTFSCRIMHMGIEQWTLARLFDKHPKLVVPDIGVEKSKAGWIKEENFGVAAIRSYILKHETSRSVSEVKLRIMANCQSGALFHFSGLKQVADFDNMPRFFNLSMIADGSFKDQHFPEYLVYGPFSDYWENYWPTEMRGPAFAASFERCAEQFSTFVREQDAKMLILLPPENAPNDKYGTVCRELVARLNAKWRALASNNGNISILEISEIAEPDQLLDARHFKVPLLKKISDRIAVWSKCIGTAPAGPEIQTELVE